MRDPLSCHSRLKQACILGVKIDVLTLEELLAAIEALILQDHKSIVSYVNIHALNIAYSTPWFRRFINQSDLVFCDGTGVKLAAKLTRQRLESRDTPPDFMEHICAMADRHHWRIFFLGASPGVAEKAANRITSKLPGLQIECQHGYFDKIRESLENQSVLKQINEFCPHILVIGFGMPLQEKWISENLEALNIKLAFPAGALFDYLSGNIPRGPRWLTDHGFEWLSRLLIEPRRLWKRYLLGNPLFFWRLLIHHFLKIPLPE